MTKKLWFAILAITFVFAVMFTGCADEETEDAAQVEAPAEVADATLVGTWVDDDGSELRFGDDGSVEVWMFGGPMGRGTFTARDGLITSRTSHVHGNFINEIRAEWGFSATHDFAWFLRSDFIEALLDLIVDVIVDEEGPFTPWEFEHLLDDVDAFPEDYLWEFGFYEMIEELFAAETETYSISGNTLTLIHPDGETTVFTRR